MAKRLDDEDRRPGEDRELEDRHPEVEAAEFEAEQPARPPDRPAQDERTRT